MYILPSFLKMQHNISHPVRASIIINWKKHKKSQLIKSSFEASLNTFSRNLTRTQRGEVLKILLGEDSPFTNDYDIIDAEDLEEEIKDERV